MATSLVPLFYAGLVQVAACSAAWARPGKLADSLAPPILVVAVERN